jgi:preprotein translocase subunit SecA
MLDWLFGKNTGATRAEDCVWMSSAARLNGIRHEVGRLTKEGRIVVVVAWTRTAFDDWLRELDEHEPLPCRDLFGVDAIRGRLARGGWVAIAMADVLSNSEKSLASVPVEILVCGRSQSRSADDTIVRFADQLGANACVVFHLSLDDALLQDYIGTLSPLLSRLQVSQDEKISSPLVTRAIASAQAKKGL